MSNEVTIRGTTYPSISAAVRATGASRKVIMNARRRGRLDTVGLGRGSQTPPTAPPQSAKPISLGGMDFPSRTALSRWLGKDDNYVCNALYLGQERRLVRAFIKRKKELMK
jgi:hypothetical protein